MTTKVTVVLNGYKRSHAAKEQYEAYRNQSIGTPDFLFWGNTPESIGENDPLPFDKYTVDGCVSAICNKNLGVWARFAYALNASTPFICIADDDTIPGRKWLENCLDVIHTLAKPAVLTCRGVRLNNNQYPLPDSYEAIGWCSENEKLEQVDFGGHCWFFPKTVLKAFWLKSPDVLPLNFGEEIQISVAPKLLGDVETYVPPHPSSDKEFWGSIDALKYGEDMNAISRRPDACQGMFDYLQWALESGYVPVKMRGQSEN